VSPKVRVNPDVVCSNISEEIIEIESEVSIDKYIIISFNLSSIL